MSGGIVCFDVLRAPPAPPNPVPPLPAPSQATHTTILPSARQHRSPTARAEPLSGAGRMAAPCRVARGATNLLGARPAPFAPHTGLRRALGLGHVRATLRCGPLRAGRGSKLQVGVAGAQGRTAAPGRPRSLQHERHRRAFAPPAAPAGVCGCLWCGAGGMHGDRALRACCCCRLRRRQPLPPPLAEPRRPSAPPQVVSKHSAVPEAQGLFNPENDKDACGVGFVAGAPRGRLARGGRGFPPVPPARPP